MKSARYEEHRNKLNLSVSMPPELTIKLATTVDEYVEGYKIIYECYMEKGYTTENKFSIRATPYHLLPTTTMILAYWNNQVIGTISLIRDNPLGLPLDAIFNLENLRKDNKICCEVSSLAIKKEYRGQGGEIFYPLVRYMWNYALNFFGVDYLVIAVNPTMYELYESIYYFQPLEKNNVVDAYDFANNNPAIGQFIDIKNSYQMLDDKYGERPFEKNLSKYLQQKSIANYLYPERTFFTHIDSPATPEWVMLFNEIIPQLERKETRNRISNAFGHPNEEAMLMSDQSYRVRAPVSFNIENYTDTRVVDISDGGFKIISTYDFNLNQPTIIRMKISSTESAVVLAQAVWKKNNSFGFKIHEDSKEWRKLIANTYPTERAVNNPKSNQRKAA